MPRIVSTLLLALLVVGAQQAALLHEIGHGFGHGVPATHASVIAIETAKADYAANQEASSYCEKCFQFAHVCGAGFSVPGTIGLIAASAQAMCTGEAADLPASAPQTRSRGPPVLL